MERSENRSLPEGSFPNVRKTTGNRAFFGLLRTFSDRNHRNVPEYYGFRGTNDRVVRRHAVEVFQGKTVLDLEQTDVGWENGRKGRKISKENEKGAKKEREGW